MNLQGRASNTKDEETLALTKTITYTLSAGKMKGKTMQLKKKFKNAFTLLEIMVVVIIVGVLATVALTSFSKTMQKQTRGRTERNVRTIASAWYMNVERRNIDPSMHTVTISNIAQINQWTGLNITPEPGVSYTVSLNNNAYQYAVQGFNVSPAYTILVNFNDHILPYCTGNCP